MALSRVEVAFPFALLPFATIELDTCMHIYYAGYGMAGDALDDLLRLVSHRLISLEYVKDIELWIEGAKRLNLKYDLIIDSGAYTAWRRGVGLDLKILIESARECQELAGDLVEEFNIINADVIPGTPGTPPTPAQVEESAHLSYSNWKQLTSAGIPTLPVHHQGEDMRHLQTYLDDGCAYVCISPANDKSKRSRIHYCEVVFEFMSKHGYNVKTHALGVTAQELLDGFKWYSVDSATCPINASFGKIWLFSSQGKLRLVSLTERLKKHKGDMHYQFMPEIARRQVDKQVEAAGLTVELLAQDGAFQQRALFNLVTYKKYEDILCGREPGEYKVKHLEVQNGGKVGNAGKNGGASGNTEEAGTRGWYWEDCRNP